MILIADGGSTKVDWCLAENGIIKKRIETKGANPFFRTSPDISKEIKEKLIPEIAYAKLQAIYFYGAGCANDKMNNIVRQAIIENINIQDDKVEVGSDMYGAALGLFGNESGIACILGTGSNSCFYDGKQIVKNISPLGFILGDEGSGAVLGRKFIGSCLKFQFGEELRNELLNFLQMSVSEILERVYKQSLPNRFLANIAPFIADNIQNEAVHQLVFDEFSDFFKKNIMQYDDYHQYKISFTGSIAYYFQDILKEAAQNLELKIAKITQAPMDGLVKQLSTV